MSGMDAAAWMPGFDPVTGMFSLPLWLAGAVAALLVILAFRAFSRMGASPAISALPQYALVAIALLLAWSFLDRSMTHDRAEARRALDARATALMAQAMMPGSALACIDAAAGEAVEIACEKSLFATPEAAAGVVAYVGAKISLLSEAAELTKNSTDENYGPPISELRRTVEADRFGVVAHVLTNRYRCTADKCDVFRLIPDRRQLTAHMRDDSFGQSVARHAASWTAAPVLAASPPAEKEKEKVTTASAPSNWNYPSSASIPAINIMTSEPAAPPPPPPAIAQPPEQAQPVFAPQSNPAAASLAPPMAVAPVPAAAPAAPAARKPAASPPRRPATNGNAAQAAPSSPPVMPPAPRAGTAAAMSPPAAAAAPLTTTPAAQ